MLVQYLAQVLDSARVLVLDLAWVLVLVQGALPQELKQAAP